MAEDQVSPAPIQPPIAPQGGPPAKPTGKRYPLGVLFVHGIGEQPMGETLKNVVDPLVRSLDLWVHGAVRCRALSLGKEAAHVWANGIPSGPSGPEPNASLHEHAQEMAASVDWPSEQAKPETPPAVLPETPWAGSAVLQDGQPPQSENGATTPAHAVLHLQTIDEQYRVSEAHALLAESWWARSFVPPSAWALLAWTFKVLPLAFGMHMADLFHGRVRRARDKTQHRGWRLWHRSMALVWLLLLTPAVVATLPVQCMLTMSVLLSLLPIKFVQEAMRALQSILIGTLGDSFLLVSSPVSRAMIVAQCKRDLQWLAGQCDQVMLVAHSQGCAVSYLALCEQRPAELTEVAWVGSGLRKLEVLRAAERDPRSLSAAWLVATMPLLIVGIGLNMLLGQKSEINDGQGYGLILVSVFWLVGYVGLIAPLRTGATRIWLSTWQSLKLRFLDIHASHDPVPHGPLSHEPVPEDGLLVPQEVRNLASRTGDHVSYWRNIEEVVLPLALRMARAMRMPLDQVVPNDAARRDAGVQRRRHRVWWLVWLRVVMWVGAFALVLSGVDHWLALGKAALAQGQGWDGLSSLDLRPLAPAVRVLLPELLLWLVVPYAVMVLVWNGWEAHEQRALLMRTDPSYWLAVVIIFAMVAAAMAPLARAAGSFWPGAAVTAIAVTAVVAAWFAFVYGAEASNAFKVSAKT